MAKKLLVIYFLLFASAVVTYAQSPWRKGQKQVLVPVEQPAFAVFGKLISDRHIDSEPAGASVRCYVTEDDLLEFENAAIQFQTEINDLNAWSASFGPRGVPQGYYTVEEINEIADSLTLNFPDICTQYSMGTSTGFYPLKVLKISDNSAFDENEAEILFDGGIHGDEIGGPENMIRLARDLCLGYGSDEYITSLVDNREIWIYYMVNPYGRANMTRYNANGIDINRDCGYMWNGEGNSPSAFSQPETKAYRKLLTENQFAIHCSYHSGTEYISYPWSYRADPSPDNANHDYLASLYALNSGYSGIPYGQGFTGMYAINGSTKDFGYGALGSISWSIEISVSKQPPAAQIVPYYLKNKQSMLTMVEFAGYGISGVITDSVTGQPIDAMLFINNYFPFSNDEIGGDYHKFLLPGEYDVTIKVNGYQTRTITGIVVSEGETTIVNAALSPVNRHFAKRIISCQIPNNNFNDEGFTPAVIGAPDNHQYSIGRFGYVVIDMGDTLTDAEGIDVIVYENDATPEGYQLLAGQTMDGPWYILGNGTGSSEFDLNGSGLSQTRYLKIKDDGDGQSQVADAGFDLDAIEWVVPEPPVDSTGYIQGYIYSLVWPEPVPGTLLTCGNYSTIADENGHFIIQADTGFVEICGSYPIWNMFDCDTVYVTSADTLTHNMYLPILEEVNGQQPPDKTFKLFPNPANDYTILSWGEGKENQEFRIFSEDGRPVPVNSMMKRPENTTIITSGFIQGIYFVVVKDAILKLIILR